MKRSNNSDGFLGASGTGFNLLGNIISYAFFTILGIRAITKLDTSWDSLTYHLPFAARIVGIFPKYSYIFEQLFENRYSGFPKFIELLQGLIWKLTGWVTSANLIGLFLLFLLVLIASKRLRIPFWQPSLFLFSVPLILIHSTSSYIDLPVACLIGISLINFMAVFIDEDYTLKSYIFIILPLALAINSKYQIVLIASVILLITCTMFIWNLRKELFNSKVPTKKFLSFIGISFIFVFLAGYIFIKNFYLYNNPFYPIYTNFGPIHFIGPESMPDTSILSPEFQTTSSMKLFYLSLSEVFLWKNNPGALWSIDMSDGGTPATYPFFKLGGYFVVNLILWIAVITFILIKFKNKKIIILFALDMFLFITVSFLPFSFSLRYWMFLPMALCFTMLVSFKDVLPKERISFLLVILLQLAIFIFVLFHNFQYIVPGDDFDRLTPANYGYNQPAYNLPSNDPVCLVNIAPITFLYKLDNPQVNIQAASSDNECVYSPLLLNIK